MKAKTKSNISKAADERLLNIPLTAELRRDLKTVSDKNGRTMRRQASMYVARGVEREMRRQSRAKA